MKRLDSHIDALIHSHHARTVALETGDLISADELARGAYIDVSVAIHAEVITSLGGTLGVPLIKALSFEILESMLRTAKQLRRPGSEMEFDYLYILGAPKPRPRLSAYNSVLDTGSEVLTIFLDEPVVKVQPNTLFEAQGHEYLPSSIELVKALRDEWCEPEATTGNRIPRLDPIPLPYSYSQYNPRQDAQIKSIAFSDPVGAARLAEEFGDGSTAAACWILAGDVMGALEVISPGAWERSILSLILNLPLNATDLIRLYRPPITTWGRERLGLVTSFLQARIDEESMAGNDVGRQLLGNVDLLWRHAWSGQGGALSYICSQEPVEMFVPVLESSQMAKTLCDSLVRDAENTARESLGHLHVGQGWVSETELFNLLRLHFSQVTTVIQHGKPQGFGRQHLDVWFPDWSIGIEYQGAQHDQAVDYFGGEEGWKNTVARDSKKRELCSQLEIKLIEVRPGYHSESLITEIKSYRT